MNTKEVSKREKKEEVKDFVKLWLEAVEKKGNNIVAGYDPKEKLLTRFQLWEEGKQYIDDVSDKVPAIKFNTKFYLNSGWSDELSSLCIYARQKGLLVLGDSKFADIGASLESGLEESVFKKMDFETFDTKTSRVTERVQAKFGNRIGLFSVVLMSNPEALKYNNSEKGEEEALRYLKHVLDAGVVGVVIGGTYKNEQVFKNALKIIKNYEEKVGRKVLILAPGFGVQGGNLSVFLQSVKNAGLDPKKVMCNVGTSIMTPEFGKTREQVVDEFVNQTKLIF